MITGNEPANPILSEPVANDGYGLTIRQHFAAMAMQGILANEKIINILRLVPQEERYDSIAETACLTADALIKELNKTL